MTDTAALPSAGPSPALIEPGYARALGAARSDRCLHCGSPTSAGAAYCCVGCEEVHHLLERDGLGRYYELRGPEGAPVSRSARRERAWLDGLVAERTIAGDAEASRVELDIQGVRCAACVWLIDQIFEREGTAGRCVVNPARGRVTLEVPAAFDLARFVDAVEAFGYRLGRATDGGAAERGDAGLLLRMGICLALAGNAMMLSVATYVGLTEGPFFDLVSQIVFALGAVSVLVGGSVFFASAWRALRHRILHLDVPIALGIALAFAGSTASFLFGSGRAAYFDTVAVFVALMLVGRWLTGRLVDKNRRAILESDGGRSLRARRVVEGRAELVEVGALREGDRLVVARDELVPVDATLAGGGASFALDWIDGESAPRSFGPGARVPAGAFNAGEAPVELVARTDWSRSPLVELLRVAPGRDAEGWGVGGFWERVSGVYVVAVLVAASTTGLGWLVAGAGAERALEVTTALLVVTCPCGFGIATPLGYELVHAGLRRAGLFVRRAGALDRLAEIDQVVFDKTGTLTTGALVVRDPGALGAIPEVDRQALYDMTARNGHPKSAAIAGALTRCGAVLSEGAAAREVAGLGLFLERDDARYELVGDGADGSRFVVRRGVAEVRHAIAFDETLRPEARAELRALAARGLQTWIASGDAPQRVAAIAEVLGVDPRRARGALAPEDKAAFLRDVVGGRSLMIGDGINDGPAAEGAHASGTPCVDRPFLAAKTDFYFVTPGLSPISIVLRAARALRAGVRRNLFVTVLYNGAAIALSASGLMEPWLAAIVMPASSLFVVGLTMSRFGKGAALWKS